MATVIARYAELDITGTYRYKLGRIFNKGSRSALWIGVNPSTADGEADDASIRRLYGFADRLNIHHWMVGNLFAFRATNPKELARTNYPIGPNCDSYLRDMAIEADIVVAGWGGLAKQPKHLRGRWKEVAGIVEQLGKPLLCFGTCSDGHPVHPLMLPYTAKLREWSAPE